ncbi:NAD(P)H-binding protein [Secundilactobacillus collinoides]|uniref:NAD(P)-binding domain-containing protein n=2 Tax=Secundilactobacillus collinoides TaxID=33960 RepID=A0A0R2B5Z0_SECCO|nr:NAD(P)H-binding protein [Secundilactobacillus collinoides]KRM74776.1 hypothetical protein FC82_GL003179 [Secundilactobacillus collinoides DSM 20515 = JCM 1123]KZL42592.1 short-chain dehydrogenase [Secundilactobacillus collinoides]
MTKIILLGANGRIARIVRQRILAETDASLTLYLRDIKRVMPIDDSRETVIEGDVNDYTTLTQAVTGQDIVVADLGGRMTPLAATIVKVMTTANVNRLIWITGLGLYHEVPGEFGRWVEESIGTPIMDDTRVAAADIETSKLNATIIRAAYMTDEDKIDYELTEKGTPFKGTLISRASIADLIMNILKDPEQHSFSSLGIDEPGTDGDRPY